MKISAFKTSVIDPASPITLKTLLDFLPPIKEQSVVAVSSKAVSLCEGRAVKGVSKDKLIIGESEYYLKKSGPYGLYLSKRLGLLAANAGVDESNGKGYLVPLPADPYASAELCRSYLAGKNGISELGVVLTDSSDTPLKWGVTGVAVAHSGFMELIEDAGKEDLFGRKLRFTRVNAANALAACAAFCMGEAAEQTPLALIEEAPFICFTGRAPTKEEIAQARISAEEDLYSPLLSAVKWKKGGK